jgi:hypothetical protein
MWIRKPKYFVKPNLPLITRHDQLPSGAIELARIQDNTQERVLWIFVKNNTGLSILYVAQWTKKNGQQEYLCSQDDFPMEFLTWFHDALTDFQKPPAEGGLRAGAMTSADQDVGGEMLSIVSAIGEDRGYGGYTVNNWSRCQRRYDHSTEFTPHEVSWAQRFLQEGGLLDLIKSLADQYKKGTL